MDNDETAKGWIERQERQQKVEAPNKPLENENFTWKGVTFQKGTAKTPVDACAIQRYQRAETWLIRWDNQNKQWEGLEQDPQKKPSLSEYLRDVLEKLE